METKGADSAEGRYKMHEGKIKCEGRRREEMKGTIFRRRIKG